MTTFGPYKERLRKSFWACLLAGLLSCGVATAALLTGTPSLQTFTYTRPGTVVSVPAQTFVQTVTVPTVTVTVGASTATAPTSTSTSTVSVTSSTPPSCNFYATTTGSDSNPGSFTAPFATVKRLAAALSAGQTGCLSPGTFTADVSLSRGGTTDLPITFTSLDAANPATIKGRLATFPGGDWITFTQLKLDGVNATGLPSPTVGSSNVTFQNVDVSNEHTAICFDLINSSTWGVARNTIIEDSRVHDCGRLPYGSTNNDHGIYASGFNALIVNNFIYRNADRGVQLRGSQGALVKWNVIDGNGEGVIFGDLDASNNTVTQNIVTNSKVRWNAESWWGTGPVGTGNSFTGNCVFATNANTSYDSNGGISGGSGYTASGNTIANPLYTDAGNGDFSLPSTSPCIGKGPAAGSIIGAQP